MNILELKKNMEIMKKIIKRWNKTQEIQKKDSKHYKLLRRILIDKIKKLKLCKMSSPPASSSIRQYRKNISKAIAQGNVWKGER